MTASFSLKTIAWKRIMFLLLLLLIPNYLVLQVQLVGPVDDWVGLGTAIDLVIILPLALYFFGFRKRVSWLVLFGLIFWGLLLANWIIPNEADAFLTYFNQSVIVFEAGIIIFEFIFFTAIIKKFPLLIQNYKNEKSVHHHFLLCFSEAVQRTFSFKNKRLNTFQFILRIVATDLAAIYYSLFSWRKKAPILEQETGQTFTFHKSGSYLGVFFMLVHAMALEVVAVHILVSQFSHIAAWIVTALDVYCLLFIISDYQAIRLSPVVLDLKGIDFQKGIRQYGFIPWGKVKEIEENTKSTKEVANERDSISLALHGIEKEQIPYVIRLNEPVEISKIFGSKKPITSIYIKMDEAQEFNQTVRSFLS